MGGKSVKVTMLFFIILSVCVNYINVKATEIENKISKQLVAIVRNDSISILDLADNEENLIDRDGNFRLPLISDDGRALAYTKNETLYIAGIDEDNLGIIKVDEKVNSYNWYNSNILVYSAMNSGLKGFDLSSKRMINYIENENTYINIVCDKDVNIYAQKRSYYGNNKSDISGIIQYNTKLQREKLIIESIPISSDIKESMIPKIAGISKLGDFLYIFCLYDASSLSSDGVPLGVYNVQQEKFTKFNDNKVFMLHNDNPIAIDPLDGSRVAINNGGGRDWNVNKSIGIVDSTKNRFEYILPEEMISTSSNDHYSLKAIGISTMTPAFSPNSNTIVYAASPAIDWETDEIYSKWFEKVHPLYSIDLSTKNITRLTYSENYFDFAPQYISGGEEIIFMRARGYGETNKYSLWRLKNSKETLIADDIKATSFDTSRVLDIYTD